MNRRPEPRLPQNLAVPNVVSAEVAVEVAHENQTTPRSERRREVSRPLFDTPDLLHRIDVVGAEFTQATAGFGHFAITPRRAHAARTGLEGHRAPLDLQTSL